jgi:hypothetical protein
VRGTSGYGRGESFARIKDKSKTPQIKEKKMADRDSINRIKQGRVPSAGAAAPNFGLLPVVLTATQLSAAMDLAGFHGANIAVLVGAFGTAASPTVYIELELQVSADNTTYVPCLDTDLLFPPGDAVRTGTATGTFFQSKTTGAADLSGVYTVGYRGQMRYLKVNVRLTGTQATGTPVAVLQTAAFPDYQPTAGNAT